MIEGVSKVLEVMGGLLLFIAILRILVGLTFCTATTAQIVPHSTAVQSVASCPFVVVTGLAQFGVQIWASVVVFGAYSTWEYDDKSSENFCEYTPYMFAFVILIIKWVAPEIIWSYTTVTYRINQQSLRLPLSTFH